MSAPRRCQGCGACEGDEQKQGGRKAPVIVKLTQVQLADYGPRNFCQRCRRLAAKQIYKLSARGLHGLPQ